jgi:truncated hemoglobin YjbI
MEHRRFLAYPEVHRPFVGGDLLQRIGGRTAVGALIDGLYDGIDTDPELRRLFSRDLTNEREAQKRFFTEWLGGDNNYSEHTHLPLKHRHDLLPISRTLAQKWLTHFRNALDSAVSDVEARRAIQDKVSFLALALVNEGREPSALRARPHGTCLRYQPAIESATLVRRGDATALGRLLKRAPDVLDSAPHAARLLHVAVLGGRKSVVELLLDSGVDVNKPSPIESLIFITPLCAARMKQRPEIEALLLVQGAKEDIFTHAFLGDIDRLREDIGCGSVQVGDPAVDALQITPVHHAVAGGRMEALHALLSVISSTNEPLRRCPRAPRRGGLRKRGDGRDAS